MALASVVGPIKIDRLFGGEYEVVSQPYHHNMTTTVTLHNRRHNLSVTREFDMDIMRSLHEIKHTYRLSPANMSPNGHEMFVTLLDMREQIERQIAHNQSQIRAQAAGVFDESTLSRAVQRHLEPPSLFADLARQQHDRALDALRVPEHMLGTNADRYMREQYEQNFQPNYRTADEFERTKPTKKPKPKKKGTGLTIAIKKKKLYKKLEIQKGHTLLEQLRADTNEWLADVRKKPAANDTFMAKLYGVTF